MSQNAGIRRAERWPGSWNHNASVISAMDYPPISLYNPADYRN
ncbi:MAG TPA: hypothetical protein VNA69_17965 [Thermoanaerobaculia bacterium]|nr:hypothetical protein [Thermoanaerobaculia bacterium]